MSEQFFPSSDEAESTPEKIVQFVKPKPRARKLKTSAWNEVETQEIPEISALPEDEAIEEIRTVEETSFIKTLSPSQSSVGKSSSIVSPKRILSPNKMGGWSSTDDLGSPGRIPSKLSTRRSSGSVVDKEYSQSEDSKKLLESSVGKLSQMSSHTDTSKTDSRAHRERIRERIQAAKERVAATAQLNAKQSKIKSPLHSKLEVNAEEAEVEEAMRRHQELRAKWKHFASTSVEIAQKQEGYDFFNKDWENEEDPVVNPEDGEHEGEGSIESKSNGGAEESKKDDEVQLMTSGELMAETSEWLPLIHYVPAQNTDWDDVKLKLRGLLFCPSSSPVPIEEKLAPDTVPRFLEEEGLYVGKKPRVPKKSKNKLEQRIMASGSERLWFGEDGEIKTMNDPLNFSAYRLSTDGPLNPLLEVSYKPAQLASDEGTVEGVPEDEHYILEVDTGEVRFWHHPLFSEEHVAGERLRELSQRLDKREGVVGRLAGKLRALRNSRDHAIQLYHQRGDPVHKLRAEKYKAEIKETRNLWLSEGRQDRSILANILEIWRDIKVMRDQQGYCATPFRLQIISTPSGEDDEWQSQTEYLMDEVEEEAMDSYNERLAEYHQQLEKWNKKKIRKDEADSSSDDEERVGRNEMLEKEPKKPKKPNISRLRAEAVEELAESLRPPEEPRVTVRLTETMDVDDNLTDQDELDRRLAVAKCSIWLALRYNGKEVGRIQGSPLSHGFVSSVNHRFSMRIQQWPTTLSLQLLETGAGAGVLFGKKLLAEVSLPIPGSVRTETALWQSYDFTLKNPSGKMKHNGVGSGKTIPGEAEVRYTSGSITARTGWANSVPNLLHSQRNDIQSKCTSNVEKLKDWAEQSNLDPNDPNNAEFFEYIKGAEKEEEKINGFFLNPLQAAFDFCEEKDLLNNPRLKLLMLRDRGQPEFRGMKFIPLNEKEIPADVFKSYEKRIAGRNIKKGRGKSEGPFEAYRQRGKEYLQALRDAVLQQCRYAQRNKTHKDIIAEDPVPDIGTLGLTFMKWLQPQRPLRPTRKERKKVPVKSLVGQEVEIIVNVVRAFEVPIRKDEDIHIAGDAMIVPVRPFVEVTFQGHRCRTTTAEGPNPTWNHDLHIPLKPPHGGLSPDGLHSIKDSIHCHLFDETIVDLIEDERERETNIHHRLERHWLGSLRIPFAALYANSRMEGTFELYSPPVLLGYERESKDFRNKTFLTLFITVHPPLHPPSPIQERLESSEEMYLEQYLDSWQKEVSKECPSRNVTTQVIDTTGKSICVTRFFKPLPPPVIVPGEATTAQMAARFVSMIPIVSGDMLFPGLFDVWLTADQVVKLLSGDGCDHAVLLSCYLLYLGYKVWLALGTGIPQGPSAYVLTKDSDGKYTVWDPSTARRYSISDAFSPLHKVHCLINDANIWMNIQKEDLIRRTNFDITKRSEWWPAFGRSVSAPVDSVQPPSLEYLPTSETETRLLQDKLEKLLRDAIMRLRPTSRTIWNRYCTATLRKLLPSLERSSWTNERSSPPDHIQELEHILTSYKMCGFPINMPYTTSNELIDAVSATGVHLNDSADIEFASAVYVHAFPSNVLSVWIYVASLVRRR